MNRFLLMVCPLKSAVPRTGGDEPITLTDYNPTVYCSPHGRG